MAQLTQVELAQRVKEILEAGLQLVGIEGFVEVELIPDTRMCRVDVVSPIRDNLKASEWDKLTRGLLENVLGRDEALRVGAIYALTPEQLAAYREQE
jgi:hypothetical protein